MSIETINQFLTKASQDPELKQEFIQALSSENQQQATFELADKHGCQCSADELWAEIQNIQSEFQTKLNQEEINEEDLQAVAGGANGVRTAAFIAAAGAVIAAGISKFGDD